MVRTDPPCSPASQLGDLNGALQFYLRAIKLKPRFSDAYNNLAGVYVMQGRVSEAIETYQMALVLNPNLVDAHSNLGNLYKAQCRLDEAKRCYLEAIRIKPDFAIAWSNLAGIFKTEGQLDAAVAYYQEAIRLAPTFADAHSNLGNALKEQGCMQEAIVCYNTAIQLRPNFAIAYGNLASCLCDLGQLGDAIRTFRYAIQLDPSFHDAYNNLGNALRQVGHLDEAIDKFRTALRLKPDHPHAYNNLGNAMRDKGHVKEAVHFYLTALRLMPKFAAAHSNLGSVFKEQGRLDQALAHYREAIAIDPLFADAYSNMGNTYKALDKLPDAIRCYSTAIKLKPGYAYAYSNLASAYKDGGKIEEAIACYKKALELAPDFSEAFANLVHSRLFICDWSSREQDFAGLNSILGEQLEQRSNSPLSVQPFHTLVYPVPLSMMRRIAERYALQTAINVSLEVEGGLSFAGWKPPHSLETSDRIRLGYVSSDFGHHPLSHLMQSVFGLHDSSRFHTACYALSSSDASSYRRKIESEAALFRDVSGLSAADAARLIHSDGIDILVNLNGYTKGARNEIFALCPAPIQVSFMGFCGTMGASYVPYMIADERVIPPENRSEYSERGIIYMPHSYFVNDYRQSSVGALEPAGRPTRAHYGIPQDKFVFCNFNQVYKIDPDVFRVWCSVLRRVPNSVLWLLRFPPCSEKYLRGAAESHGIARDRLIFTDVASKEEHIARGVLADLFLDTSACNAHTTACDILWAGTPLLTTQGKKMSTRIAASLLHAAGLPEMVTSSLEEYEERAVMLATDSEALFTMRKHLEEQRMASPLFDTPRWVRNLEEGFTQVLEQHRKGLAPADVHIHEQGGGAVLGCF